jgi:hypothetical protein
LSVSHPWYLFPSQKKTLYFISNNGTPGGCSRTLFHLKAKMATPKVTLPGRLGDPSMDLKTDPRMNPQLLAGFSVLGGGVLTPDPPITPHSPLEEIMTHMAQSDNVTQMLYDVSIAKLSNRKSGTLGAFSHFTSFSNLSSYSVSYNCQAG